MNGVNGDAVNCRSQLRKIQKLYNAAPELMEWKGLDSLDLWLDGPLGVIFPLVCSFLEIQASSHYPNSAEYPNPNQCSESTSRDM